MRLCGSADVMKRQEQRMYLESAGRPNNLPDQTVNEQVKEILERQRKSTGESEQED
jgi:protein-tyrosine-phosphatase